ncbi:MAG: 50S ribosomal protein L22, partial [Candidatus Omnitrophica bacterium]|nr:50S ribosomal protein L22 [Candidatus Omnitrophota bacterium]
MLAKAYTKYIRMSARKVRLVIELVKGKNLEEAGAILDSVNKGAKEPIKKTINSAFSNLNCNRTDKLLAKDVVISELRAEGGPMLKRYRSASMGRATPIKHRTTHIYVELDGKVSSGGHKGKKAAVAEAAPEVKQKAAVAKTAGTDKVKTSKPKKAKSGS